MNINWYPGHMKKTEEGIKKNSSLVDIIYEVIDSRIPFSSQIPELNKIVFNKPRLLIMNKSDLANEGANKEWCSYFKHKGVDSVLVDSINKKGINDIFDITHILFKDKKASLVKRGIESRPIRTMIIGIPNVGKSSLINSITKRKGTRVGNKPGITKAPQWIRIKKDLELLDTPGILWPKFEKEEIGLNLAFTGAIRDEILDIEFLAIKLIRKLNIISKDYLEQRYGIIVKNRSAIDILNEIGLKRGCMIRGGKIDLEKASRIVLDEFRKGLIGRITLELPN